MEDRKLFEDMRVDLNAMFEMQRKVDTDSHYDMETTVKRTMLFAVMQKACNDMLDAMIEKSKKKN